MIGFSLIIREGIKFFIKYSGKVIWGLFDIREKFGLIIEKICYLRDVVKNVLLFDGINIFFYKLSKLFFLFLFYIKCMNIL